MMLGNEAIGNFSASECGFTNQLGKESSAVDRHLIREASCSHGTWTKTAL